MEPPLALKAQVLRIRDRQVALAFNQPDGDSAVTLLNLIYNGEETFHWPKRLSTSDALLHWLGSLWRPDPILRRFS